MNTIRVFTYATNRDGSATIGAPRPGEFFQDEKNGGALERKSPQQSRMLRRILAPRTMSEKVADEMNIEENTIFAILPGKRSPADEEFFIAANGMIGAEGVAKWSADNEAVIVVPITED